MKRKAIISLLFMLSFTVVILSIQASYSASKSMAMVKAESETVTVSNGILNASVHTTTGFGEFSIGTGPNHPKPNLDVLYGHPNPGTTYTTIKVLDTHAEYVTTDSNPSTSAGYTLKHLDASNPNVTVQGTKVTATWTTTEHLSITQLIEISGSDISNTFVRISLKVTNNDNVTHYVGVRYEWDIMIDERDGSYLRPWTDQYTPQSWLGTESNWTTPEFQFWETTNNLTDPMFSIYGSVTLPATTPQPTKPDKLLFARWGNSYSVAYDYNTTGQEVAGIGKDSAVLYYWNPANISSGASREVTAYITTFKEAIQGGDSTVWTPSAEGVLLASALTVSVTSGVSAVASAVTNPETCPSNKFAEKTNDLLPDSVKKWLDSFICSKTGASIEHRVGVVYLFTKQEIISMAISLLAITFAFSYAKADNWSQILPLIPIVLATSILVDLVKDVARELLARHLGVWSEYRLWYFGLVMFLISSVVFRAPFSSPNRIRHHSPKLTKQAVGLLSLLPVVVSLFFAALFYMLFTNGFVLIGNMGLVICLTAAFFDTMPIPPMNGKDIYDWNKILWLMIFIACFAFYALCLLLL